MNPTRRNWTSELSVLLIALTAVSSGCGTPKPKPVAWNLSITKKTYSTIEVDLIGVPKGDKALWEGYDLDQYWTPGDQRRQDAHPLSTNLVYNEAWIVARTNAQWHEWLDHQKATDLLIIANLPGTKTNFGSGRADPRRKFVPLDKRAWDAKKRTLEFEVQDTLINPLTKQRD